MGSGRTASTSARRAAPNVDDALFVLDDVTTTRGSGDEHTHPLRQVSVAIRGGRTTAVVGPSGGGKSTLLRLLNRLEEPAHGRVLLDGRPLAEHDVLALRRRVGLVLQRPTPFAGSVLENLRVGEPNLTRDDALELLSRAGLERPEDFVDREATELSGGEAQRVCLARSLAVRPQVLLLDEPTSSLDVRAAKAVEVAVSALAADPSTTVVLVSHDLAQARRLADDAVLVIAGRVVEFGPASRVLRRPGTREARAWLDGFRR